VNIGIRIILDETIQMYSAVISDDQGHEVILECLSKRDVDTLSVGEMIRLLGESECT